MAIIVCPNCNRTVAIADNLVDFVHDCDSGNDAIDFEDVLVVGDSKDYEGEHKVTAPLFQAAENKIWGTKGQAMGEEPVHEVTDRGRTKTIYRQRRKKFYIKLDKGKNSTSVK